MVSLRARMLNAYTRRYRKALADRDYNPSIARSIRERAEDGSHERPRLEWIDRRSQDGVLYAAGGGFCFGASGRHRRMLKLLSERCDVSSALLHYRLAPEHPFPAPIVDTVALLDEAVRSNPDSRFVVAGDSAGAMAVLMALIENRQLVETVSGGFFFSPWTDLTLSGRSLFANAGHDPLFGPAALHHKVFYYIGDQPVDLRRASPLWSDLSALPPLLVQVGSTEVMLDDSTRLVERVRAAGVSAQLEVWEQMPHVFQIDDSIPEAADALASVSKFVSSALRKACRDDDLPAR